MECIISAKGEISNPKSSLGHLYLLVEAIMACSPAMSRASVGSLSDGLLHSWRLRAPGSQIGRLPSPLKHFFLSCWVACDICS